MNGSICWGAQLIELDPGDLCALRFLRSASRYAIPFAVSNETAVEETGMFGRAFSLVFFIAASFNLIVASFFLRRIAKKVHQAQPNQKRKLSILSDAPRLIRAHHQLFPNDESMLWFWLSLLSLLFWLSGMTYSMLAYP